VAGRAGGAAVRQRPRHRLPGHVADGMARVPVPRRIRAGGETGIRRWRARARSARQVAVRLGGGHRPLDRRPGAGGRARPRGRGREDRLRAPGSQCSRPARGGLRRRLLPPGPASRRGPRGLSRRGRRELETRRDALPGRVRRSLAERVAAEPPGRGRGGLPGPAAGRAAAPAPGAAARLARSERGHPLLRDPRGPRGALRDRAATRLRGDVPVRDLPAPGSVALLGRGARGDAGHEATSGCSGTATTRRCRRASTCARPRPSRRWPPTAAVCGLPSGSWPSSTT